MNDREILDNRSLSPNANELLEQFSQQFNSLDVTPHIKIDPNANTPPPSPADYKIESKSSESATSPFAGKLTCKIVFRFNLPKAVRKG